MTPTLEEVKKAAIECEIFDRNGYMNELSLRTLQTFAQHYIMVGRITGGDLTAKAASSNNTGE